MCPLSGRSPAQEPGARSVLGKDLESRELEKGNLRVSPPPPPAGAKAGVEKAPLRRWRWENCGRSSPKFAPARGMLWWPRSARRLLLQSPLYRSQLDRAGPTLGQSRR